MGGPRIAGYDVLRELGRGGMGVVYAVRCPETGRELALKVVQQGFGPEEALRFRREAEAMARVRHPGVVRIHAYDVGPRGEPYLVSELVPGRDLKAAAREGAIPPRRAAELARDLARAVAAIHAEGIVHRDLKPSNVLLRDDGQPVIIDFGLARVLDAASLTATGMVLGTPGFLAPEQALGGPIEARTDVYGLGALLFWLLARRPPFEGSVVQVLNAVLEREPRWPSADDRAVPAGLEAVCRRAMARDPARRPPTADALADELEGWLARDRAAGPWRRAALLGGVALALAGLLGGALLARRAAPPAPAAPTAPAAPGPDPPPTEPGPPAHEPGPAPPEPGPAPGEPRPSPLVPGPRTTDRPPPPPGGRPERPARFDPARSTPDRAAAFEQRRRRGRGQQLLALPSTQPHDATCARFVGPRELIVLRQGAGRLLVWRLELDEARPLSTASRLGPGLACLAEGELVVASGSRLQLVRRPPEQPPAWVDWPATDGEGDVVDLAADGRRVVVARAGGLELRTAPAGERGLMLAAPPAPPTRVAFAGGHVIGATAKPDSRLLAWSLQDGAVRERELHLGICALGGLALAGAAQAFVGTEAGAVERLALDDLGPESKASATYAVTGDPRELRAIALHAATGRLYTATRFVPGCVRAWDLASPGAPLPWTRAFDRRSITDLQVSLDGALLAVAFDDGGVEVWSAP